MTKTNKAVAPKAQPKSAPEADVFHLTLKMGEYLFTASSPVLADAFLALKPPKIFAKAVFTAEKDGKQVVRTANAPLARKVIVNKLAAQIFAKGMTNRLR